MVKRSHRKGKTTANLDFPYLLFHHAPYGWSKQMPTTGADFFLLDRKVIDAFSEFKESNVNLFALITWMGFRQSTITYDKQPRLHGRSGWSIGKKVKLVIDSITSFSYLPVRLMSYLGFAIALFGFYMPV